MINAVPPAFLYIIGALILPCVKNHRLKQGLALLIPVLAFVNLLSMPHGTFWTVDFLKYQLILGKVDSLSLVFGFIFVIASFISMLYGIHIKETASIQQRTCMWVVRWEWFLAATCSRSFCFGK